MRMTKKITSIVLAVLMVVSMMSVMAISASAAGENFEVVALGDGATGAVGNQFVDINDAMAAAGDNGTIKLIADMEFDGNSGFIFVSNKNNITFDLNGHTITSNGTHGINLSSMLPGYATFTVKDTSSPKKGEIITTVRPDYPGCACISGNTGREIVIESGKFTSDGKALYVEGKGATIKSGTINGDIYGEAPVEIKGGTINGDVTVTGTGFYFDSGWSSHSDASTATITGGTINGDVTQAAASNAITISGGTINGDVVPAAGSDSITVTGGTFAGDVSQYVDDTDLLWEYTNAQGKTQYLKSAPSAYNNGTYKLLKDFTSTSYITPSGTSNKDITIDLNGHTYSSSATRSGYQCAFYLNRNGTAASHNKFTIKNGNVAYTNADSPYSAVIVNGKYIDVIIDNVTVNSAVCGVQMTGEGQSLTINDSTITGTNDFALATNGSSTKNGTITVNNSTLTSNGSVGVYLPGDADATFNNATVSGTTAMYIKGGNVEINGGSYTGTGAKAGYTYNGNGCNPTGDAIVIDNCKYPGGAPTVSVTGGTFISENAEAVASYAGAKAGDEAPDAINNFISGGNFSSDVSDLVVDGKMADNVGAGVEGAPFTITLDTNPLNPLNTAAADINDGNLFGLECKYLKGTLLGVQTKAHHDAVTSENGEQEAAEGNDLRFVAVLDYNLLKDADDYGFVIAKVNANRTYSDTNINGLTANWGNGEKTISAKGTYNTVCGTSEDAMKYGNPDDDTTAYKYVTCAVNGIDDASKIVVRFYYEKDGKTYYAKYAGQNYQYTGCMAGITAAGNVY